MVSSRILLPNVFAIRFDFGVPLEDICYPDDLHPRIKLLFSKALQSWHESDETSELILQNEDSSWDERFSLKEKLILDTVFDWNYSAGTYFWVLRHFLGLLPIPLLPKYAKNLRFSWEKLAKQCKDFFQNYRGYKSTFCGVLDQSIAESVRMLPFQHHLFLTYFMSFLRKVSRRKSYPSCKRFDRISIMSLTNFFCSAIFFRPYRPGYTTKRDPYQFLLVYLILRWTYISHHSAKISQLQFLESDFNQARFFQKSIPFEKSNKTAQTADFILNPDVITIYKDFPIILSRQKVYLTETGCQTDTDLSEKDEDRFQSCIENDRFSKADPYKLTYFDTNTILEQPTGEKIELSDTVFQSAADFSLNSILDDENWEKIRKETLETVKKVEEYIYDDYESFEREEFNQIFKENPTLMPSFQTSQKMPKKPPKTDYTVAEIHQSTPRSSPEVEEDGDITDNIHNLTFDVEKDDTGNRGCKLKVEEKNSSSDKDKEGDTTYEKFPDVFDEDPELLKIIDDQNEAEPQSFEDKCEYFETFVQNMCRTTPSKQNIPDITRKVNTSKNFCEKKSKKSFQDIAKNIPLKDRIEELEIQSEHDFGASKKYASRKKYVLKRIRMSLEFLRTLTPKKSDFHWLEKKVKYQRFKSGKGRANSI